MIYLDNASTTYIYPEVKEAIIQELDYFGNPSNLYNIGYKQFEKIIEEYDNDVQLSKAEN